MPDLIRKTEEAGAVAELLAAGAGLNSRVLTEHGGPPVAVVPERWLIQPLPVQPLFVPRTVTFSDVDSFAAYTNRFLTANTLLFAAVTDTDCKLTAHLDYHGAANLEAGPRARGWSSHQAVLVCSPTREWKTWLDANGADDPFTQAEFAQFLEDNERVFLTPDAASLLELVTTLEGKNNVRFNSAMRLQNGRCKLSYEEDVELRGGVDAGSIEVPSELICSIIPFENGPEPYKVRSRLRYRIQNKQIVFWYETITPHLILRDAARAVMDAVRAKVAVPLLIGG